MGGGGTIEVPTLEPHHFVTEPMDSERHWLALILLYELCRTALEPRSDVFVGADLVVYFSELQVRNKDFRAPDVFAVLGVEPHTRDGWIVWREGGKYPDMVIELMSAGSRDIDLGAKRRIYGTIWRLREYYAFDPESGELHAFERGPEGLVPSTPGPEGRFRSDVLGGWLGISQEPWKTRPGPWLRVFRDDGTLVPNPDERADAEAARADALAREVEALRAEVAAP